MLKQVYERTLKVADLQQATPFNRFDASLSVRYDEEASATLNKDYWRVIESFKFYVGDELDRTWVVVPAGFLTDGASVPWPFWSILPPWGVYGQAAVVHDILCETLTYHVHEIPTKIDRKRADRIFKEAMIVANVPTWKRRLLYLGVRAYATIKPLIPWSRAKRTAHKQYLEKKWLGELADPVQIPVNLM